MALTLGTNCGFVATAPTEDPAAATQTVVDGWANGIKDTSPATATKITEVGFWMDSAANSTNCQVGLYSDAGAGEPETLLYVTSDQATGTTPGWIVFSGLNWSIDSSTTYWIAVQADSVVGVTYMDWVNSGGSGWANKSGQTALPSDWGTATSKDADAKCGLYAVWEAGAAGSTIQVNIGDAWKAPSALYINIGDVWKQASAAYINIGDAWKQCLPAT